MRSNSQISQITDEIVRRTKESLGDKLYKIILFGSYARGDFCEDSDINVMVLVEPDTPEKLKEEENLVWDIGWDIGGDNNIMVTAFLKDRQHFYEWMDAMAFYRNVEEEGVLLYGA